MSIVKIMLTLIFCSTVNAERAYNLLALPLKFAFFQATINILSEPIDVYNEWIDACEAANS